MKEETINVNKLINAFNDAIAHVYRQSNSGKHEQDRIDAKEWLKHYGQKKINANIK
jgi:hypothetical protein